MLRNLCRYVAQSRKRKKWHQTIQFLRKDLSANFVAKKVVKKGKGIKKFVARNLAFTFMKSQVCNFSGQICQIYQQSECQVWLNFFGQKTVKTIRKLPKNVYFIASFSFSRGAKIINHDFASKWTLTGMINFDTS